MKIIAHIHSDFYQKFGIPRQSNLAPGTEALVVFQPEYRRPEALRGLSGFSHIWLIWQFSEAVREDWSPTVRPPRLGGNKRMGVFATRSPYRPNPIGLSSVKLLAVEDHPEYGMVLRVSGADLLNGTPIYDIKPYLPSVDSHPDAIGGFADDYKNYHLEVNFPENLLEAVPADKRTGLLEVLGQDPRPSYQEDPLRIYGLSFAGFNVQFTVDGDVLTVCGVERE